MELTPYQILEVIIILSLLLDKIKTLLVLTFDKQSIP